VIKKHIQAEESDIDRIEGMGALNFLALDDLLTTQEGEQIDSLSIIKLPMQNQQPQFPDYSPNPNDPFLQQVNASGKKWVIITDNNHQPCFLINANSFLRAVCMSEEVIDPMTFVHIPIVVRDEGTLLGRVITKLKVNRKLVEDDVIDEDVILLWDNQKRVITGADILGRLLRGISARNASQV
jgi:hypothetical protein